jgi:hypothetical protein
VVEKAMVNLLGKGSEEMPWPVILEQKKYNLQYFYSHSLKISGISGIKKLLQLIT